MRGSRATAADDDLDPAAKARQICLRLLTVRARTRRELATALARRGIDDDTASAVLDRFDDVGLIDDAAFAESWVRSGHQHRGLGRRALAMQLRRKGVDDDVVGDAVAAVDPEAEEAMARSLVARKLRGTMPADEVSAIRSLVGMLARRGYPEGMAYRVVRDELRAVGRDAAVLDDAAESLASDGD